MALLAPAFILSAIGGLSGWLAVSRQGRAQTGEEAGARRRFSAFRGAPRGLRWSPMDRTVPAPALLDRRAPTASAAGRARDALARAHALFLQRQDAPALPLAQAAIALAPQRADSWTLLGILQQRLGRAEAAERAYREALRLDAGYADAWTNLGNLLREGDDRRGALLAFQQAMLHAPGSSVPAYNLGVALEHFGDWPGALAAFEAAVECDPGHVDARWNGALALLRAGRFEEGFRDYEVRFQRGEPGPRECAQPVWTGGAPDGRTILVWAEQGFGDTLQFLRFVPQLARRGARVILEIPATLAGLAARVDGVAEVCVRGAEPPAFDAHVALMSLPFALGVAPDAPPSRAPYLRASEPARARWCDRLLAHARPGPPELAVGLVWAGNPTLRNARERAPGLAVVRPLLDAPGLRWYSLQKGAGRDELEHGNVADRLVDLDAEIADFDDTAAAIANLDIVVTCDTAVAHLAGALGKPTLVMLPFAHDWRYGSAPRGTAWYPSMRLFRQAARGDWTNVLSDVSAALVEAVASPPSGTLAAAHASSLKPA
jgi:Tfp pilus assembly protein PilF